MKPVTYILVILLLVFPEFVTIAQDEGAEPEDGVAISTQEENMAQPEQAAASSAPVFSSEDDFELTDENTFAIDDPLEQFNRGMFMINKGLDTVVFKPVAYIYRGIVPEVGRDRVDSVLANMKEPVNIVNSILQGDPEKASRAVGRLLVNTILGVGGLFDVASLADGLEPVNEDFGRTLAKYGADTGPYLFLPVIGPTSPRDIVGRGADFFMDPYVYSVHKDAVLARDGVRFVNTRESFLEVTDNIEQTSIDEYATVRSIYAQKRKEIKK